MTDKTVGQLTPIEQLTGDEYVVIGVNDKLARVKASLLQGTPAAAATKISLGLDKVDNTPDLDKPISTAVASALAEKAVAADLAGFATTQQVNGLTLHLTNDIEPALISLAEAINTKADKTALDAFVTQVSFDEELLGKADKTELSSYITIATLDEALAPKADKSELVGLATSAALEQLSTTNTAALLEKADKVHGHAYEQITDLVAFLDYIKNAMRPLPVGDSPVVTETTADIGVTIDNINGYNLDALHINVRYKLDSDLDWTTAASIQCVNGTTHYNSLLTGLTAATTYSVELTLVDTNNPGNPVPATIFSVTTAAAPL